MYVKNANKFYENNKRYLSGKITILDLALAAMEDAIGEAYEQETLQDTFFDLGDFRERQAHLIFEEIMDMSPLQIEEITQS